MFESASVVSLENGGELLELSMRVMARGSGGVSVAALDSAGGCLLRLVSRAGVPTRQVYRFGIVILCR